MDKEQIDDIIDKYGIDRILQDNGFNTTDVFEILDDLGYINLSMYINDDDRD